MNTQRIVGILIAGLVLVVLGLKWPFAAFGDGSLFQDAPAFSARQSSPSDAHITRERSVRVNWNALPPDARELRLNLFDDVILTAEQIRLDPALDNGYVWVGKVTGVPESTVTLSVLGDTMAGSVRLNGQEKYTITQVDGGPAGETIHLIREVDPTRIIEPTGTDVIIPRPSADELGQLDSETAVACEDGSVIDVMIVYTPAARDWAGGTDAMEALINLRLSEMNSANFDSQAGFIWRLAAAKEVDYTESGDLMKDLDRLQLADDGHLESVHPDREAVYADMVNMLVASGTDGACGLAYQMNELQPWFADYAFAVTALDYADPYTCSSLTLAHEFGHGMGNAHDKDNSQTAVLFPYSYGFQSPDDAFRTIMAYDCPGGCPRINQWSNPNVMLSGLPTGMDYDPGLGYGADVVRSMQQSAELVANFQPRCETALPTPTPTATEVTPTPPEPTMAAPTETPLPTATATDIPPTPTSTVPPPTATATLLPTDVAPTEPAPTPSPTMTSMPTLPTPTATAKRLVAVYSSLAVADCCHRPLGKLIMLGGASISSNLPLFESK